MLALVVLSVTTVSASDFNVTTQNNTVVENYEGTFSELQSYIDSNSSINLDKDFNMGSNGSPLTISKDLTINGNGYCIIGNGKSSIINIKSGNVILNDIVLESQHDGEPKRNFDGGAIYNNGVLTVNSCIFMNNDARNGGAIYNNDDGVLTVNSCKFTNNTADNGGAIYSKNKHNILTINNSEFKENCANYLKEINLKTWSYNVGKGGAIYSPSNITIDGSKFFNNHADTCGGAIYNDEYGAKLKIRNSEFVSNRAGEAVTTPYRNSGGAVCARHITSLEDSSFYNNFAQTRGGAIYAKTLKFQGKTNKFFSNIAGTHGGAIYIDAGIIKGLSNENIIFNSNTAKAGNGGAIYIDPSYIPVLNYGDIPKEDDESGHVVVGIFRYCSFVKNTAGMRGGVIFINSMDSVSTFTNNIFIDNQAKMGNIGFTLTPFDGFDLGPNYYGINESSRQNQFYFSKQLSFMECTIMEDILPAFLKQINGYEQKIVTWFNNTLDVFDNSTALSNGDAQSEKAKAESAIMWEKLESSSDQLSARFFKLLHSFLDGEGLEGLWNVTVVKGLEQIYDIFDKVATTIDYDNWLSKWILSELHEPVLTKISPIVSTVRKTINMIGEAIDAADKSNNPVISTVAKVINGLGEGVKAAGEGVKVLDKGIKTVGGAIGKACSSCMNVTKSICNSAKSGLKYIYNTLLGFFD